MRVLIQRVSKASVIVESQLVSKIDVGLLVLVGIEYDDNRDDIEWLVRKITNLRIFNDEEGKMNISIQDINGEILAISQFTLFASTKKGNRPSYLRSASPDVAEPLYDAFCDNLRKEVPTHKGIFGADMKVDLINDGPVTIWIDSRNRE